MEKLKSEQICMPCIRSCEQIADVVTKGHPKRQFEILEDIFKPTWGGVLEDISNWIICCDMTMIASCCNYIDFVIIGIFFIVVHCLGDLSIPRN